MGQVQGKNDADGDAAEQGERRTLGRACCPRRRARRRPRRPRSRPAAAAREHPPADRTEEQLAEEQRQADREEQARRDPGGDRDPNEDRDLLDLVHDLAELGLGEFDMGADEALRRVACGPDLLAGGRARHRQPRRLRRGISGGVGGQSAPPREGARSARPGEWAPSWRSGDRPMIAAAIRPTARGASAIPRLSAASKNPYARRNSGSTGSGGRPAAVRQSCRSISSRRPGQLSGAARSRDVGVRPPPGRVADILVRDPRQDRQHDPGVGEGGEIPRFGGRAAPGAAGRSGARTSARAPLRPRPRAAPARRSPARPVRRRPGSGDSAARRCRRRPPAASRGTRPGRPRDGAASDPRGSRRRPRAARRRRAPRRSSSRVRCASPSQ